MDGLLPVFEYQSLTVGTTLLRLGLAALIGGFLGIERSRKMRPAGLRTYMLICVGACAVMLCGIWMHQNLGGDADPTRMAAQVISGIGFIGVGTIMTTANNKVKGLTTAAGIWAVACTGLAVGCGFYVLAVGAFLLLLVTMTFADKLELKYYRHLNRLSVRFIVTAPEDLRPLTLALSEKGVTMTGVEAAGFAESGLSVSCVLRCEKHVDHRELLRMIMEDKHVCFAEMLDI